MTVRLHLSVLVVFALMLTQTADDCTSQILLFLDATDIKQAGKQANDPILEGAGNLLQSLAEVKTAEQKIDEAVKKQDVPLVDEVIKERPNDPYLRFLKAAMLTAQDQDTRAYLTMAGAIGVAQETSGLSFNDAQLQSTLRISFAKAMLTVMDQYQQGSAPWLRLRTAYCANMKELRDRPSAADFLAIAAFPNFNCPA